MPLVQALPAGIDQRSADIVVEHRALRSVDRTLDDRWGRGGHRGLRAFPYSSEIRGERTSRATSGMRRRADHRVTWPSSTVKLDRRGYPTSVVVPEADMDDLRTTHGDFTASGTTRSILSLSHDLCSPRVSANKHFLAGRAGNLPTTRGCAPGAGRRTVTATATDPTLLTALMALIKPVEPVW